MDKFKHNFMPHCMKCENMGMQMLYVQGGEALSSLGENIRGKRLARGLELD